MPWNKSSKYYVYTGVGLEGDRQAVSVATLFGNNSAGKENTVWPVGGYRR